MHSKFRFNTKHALPFYKGHPKSLANSKTPLLLMSQGTRIIQIMHNIHICSLSENWEGFECKFDTGGSNCTIAASYTREERKRIPIYSRTSMARTPLGP